MPVSSRDHMCLPTELPDEDAAAHSIDSISDMLKVVFSDDLLVLSIRASRNGYLYSCVGRDDPVSYWYYRRQSGASTSAISLG